MVCTLLAGVNVVAFAADDTDTVPVAKFYNDTKKGGDGEHLFTKDQDEMSWLTSLPTWNNEGVAWNAPVSSSTSVWRCYNPNSGEHLYVDEDYADYLASTGWNKEKLAFYSDDNMGVPVYRLWNGLDGVGSHHFTTDAGEVEWLAGQGWTVEDVAFYGVKEEPVVAATLIDLNGLQSNGTAYCTDDLMVTYTPDLGDPKQVTWFRNGTAIGTEVGSELDFRLNPTYATLPSGSYFATITNVKGETFKSNEITVSDQAVAATLSDFDIVQDYTYGVDETHAAKGVDYAPTTDKLVATVTMNKLYPGEFYVVDSTSKDLANDKIALVDGTVSTDFTLVTNKEQFTDAAALKNYTEGPATNKGLMYRNNDGSMTFKIVLDGTTNLTRGKEYTLLFQQTSVPATTIGQGNEIKTQSEVAPYLNAPVAIQIASVDTSANPLTGKGTVAIGLVEIGPEGPQKAAWMGGDTQATAELIGGTVTIYSSATSDVSAKKHDNEMTIPAQAFLGAAGGMFAVPTTDKYFVAELTLNDGIYGEEEVTLTSQVASPAKDAAVGFAPAYTALMAEDYFVPTSVYATVTSSYDADGTLMLYRNISGQNWANAAAAKAAIDASGKAELVTVGEANKGEKVAEIENALSKMYTGVFENQYAIVFVPDDTTEWKVVVSDPIVIDELPGSIVLAKTEMTTQTMAAVTVYNQFGSKITGNLGTTAQGLLLNMATAEDYIAGTGDLDNAKITITADKKLTVDWTGVTNVANGDRVKCELPNGQTIHIKVTDNTGVGAGNPPAGWTVWID